MDCEAPTLQAIPQPSTGTCKYRSELPTFILACCPGTQDASHIVFGRQMLYILFWNADASQCYIAMSYMGRQMLHLHLNCTGMPDASPITLGRQMLHIFWDPRCFTYCPGTSADSRIALRRQMLHISDAK